MTYAEIKQLALRQLDEDPHDMSEYGDMLGVYINEGYQIAVCDHLRPRERFTLTTDEDGRTSIDGLGIRYIPEVTDEDGRSVYARLDDMGEALQTSVRSGKIRVTAVIEYPALEREDDVPRLPEFAHAALADYACYRYLSNGNLAKQSRAGFYYGQFARQMGRIDPQAKGSVTGYKNLYTVTQTGWMG